VEWVVTTGKTVEEAVDAALDELGVDEQDAEINVLEEPRPGLFGRVRGEARVQARVRPSTPRPKVERRDRRRRTGATASPATSDAADDATDDPAASEPPAPTTPTRARGAATSRPASGSRARRPGARAATPEPEDRDGEDAAPIEVTAVDGGDSSTPADESARSGSTRSGGARGRRGSTARATQKDDPSRPSDAPRPEPVKPTAAETTAELAPDEGQTKTTGSAAPTGGATMTTVSPHDQAEVMQEFLEGLLDVFDLDGDVTTVDVDADTVELRIEGSDLGLLIGPKGATLTAVQDLARSVAQRQLPGPHEGWVRVDVSGYRQRRREALERFARQVADDVLATGTAKVLEPMTPADRKVVHDVINGIDGVTTSSEGEEPRRRVVVQPAG
jgi:spoIIIJ-associated protein